MTDCLQWVTAKTPSKNASTSSNRSKTNSPPEPPRSSVALPNRHVLVDTLGNILALKVTPADVQDRDGANLLLGVLTMAFSWLKFIRADGGYSGKLVREMEEIPRHRRVKLEIVKRSDDIKGFKVLPKRWIVERTFGWLIQSRRLVWNFEVRIVHAEAMIDLSMSNRMLARIAGQIFLRQPHRN